MKGRSLLHNSQINKQNAFSLEERRNLCLEGLLPFAVETISTQVRRESKLLERIDDSLEKYVHLNRVFNRNNILFFKVLESDLGYYIPLLMEAIGRASLQYSKLRFPTRGLFITRSDRGRIGQMLKSMASDDIRLIAMSDGASTMMYKDNGMNVVAELDGRLKISAACGGVSLERTLPIVVDVGTNDDKLVQEEFYAGLKQNKLDGKEYEGLLTEFFQAVSSVFPQEVLFQLYGMSSWKSTSLLQNVKPHTTGMFNDDIQGVACIVLSGILASLKVKSLPSSLLDHRIVVLGDNAVACAIAELIAFTKMKVSDKLEKQEARSDIWLCDSKGLIHSGRTNLNEEQSKFAHKFYEEGACFSFYYAVEEIKPTIIIGASGMRGSFEDDIIENMSSSNQVPIIITTAEREDSCECSAKEAFEGSNFRAFYASGYNYGPIKNPSTGEERHPGYATRLLLSTGLASGMLASGCRTVNNELLYTAAITVASQVSTEDIKNGSLFPAIQTVKETSYEVAMAVAKAANTLGFSRKKHGAEDLSKQVSSFIGVYEY